MIIRVFEDAAKVSKASKKALFSKSERAHSAVDVFHFDEGSANAYKDWNVVKKNKFGKKQARTFGVDGRKIYNSKRGESKNTSNAGVQRAEREINTIQNIDIIEGDSKTFRITWLDDKDVYNIEYTCDTVRECAEIVAKVKFILSRMRTARN